MWKQTILLILVAFISKLVIDFILKDNKNNATVKPDTDLNSNNNNVYDLDFMGSKIKDENKLYLAILGNIYDVESGAKHYKKGGSYSHFIGKDASRSFVTGDFVKDLNDQIDDLSDAQIADLFNWKSFYDKTYVHIGILKGKFYDENGQKTEYLLNAEEKLEKSKQTEQINAKFTNRFPPCNSEWTQEKGQTKVWCTTESGGISRKWIGYPRLVYNPNNKIESCACVNKQDLDHPNVKTYSNCDKKSTICKF